MDLKLNIKGPRVALVDAEEVNTTGILLPDNAQRRYFFGKVVAIGDGITLDGKIKPHHFQVGDVGVLQTNPMMIANCKFTVRDQRFMLVLQDDVIAKVTNGVAALTIDTFEPAGEWVLCSLRAKEEVGGIIIPNADSQFAAQPPSLHLEKAGKYSDLTGMPVGTELLAERSRATPIQLGKTRYVYLNKSYIYGTVDES